MIAKKILYWYDNNKRSLPWRNKTSLKQKEYFTLVSEFMLQQTQVKTVIPYFNNFLKNNFLLLPTVTIYPPLLEDCKDEPYYDEVNLISLRNTTLANYMNGCSISLPYSKDDKPIGIMLNGTTKNDEKHLGISANVETVLSK